MVLDPSDLPDVSGLVVGVIGGTGEQGRGLAYRFARAGQRVVLGSRVPERGRRTAAQVAALPGVTGEVTGGGNDLAASSGDVVVVSVPWSAHAETLRELREQLAGRIVVDCVNPLGFDQWGPYALPVPEGSAAQQAAALLPESRVCAAFHHVSAADLNDPSLDRIHSDVLVLGDDRATVDTVRALAARIPGMRGLHAGRLRNAGPVEAFTANLVAINRRYKCRSGVRVTGL